MHTYHKVVLALGSNLGDKKQHLLSAINLIHNKIAFVVQTSAVYETSAWGFNSFPFYNMCILVHTHLLPEELLKQLKKLEHFLGRTEKKTEGYEARTVDIDLIYYDDFILKSDTLVIPHAQMQHRKFVLVPLNDLTIDWKHPVLHQSVNEMLAVCNDHSHIKKLIPLHCLKTN